MSALHSPQRSGPGTSLVADPSRPRRGRLVRRVLAAAVLGGVMAGGMWALWPQDRPQRGAPPASGPGARRAAVVTAGVPATLSDLTAYIGGQEALVRARPGDARAWAGLGAAYVERGRRTADAADYPRAEQALRASLKAREEGNAEALAALAALADARRDFPAARRWGEEALKLAPKRWTSYPPLIDAYDGLGDYQAVRRTLEKLTGLRTGAAARPAVMARTAAVYRDRGWREDATAQLSDAAAAARSPAEQAAYLAATGQLAWERGDREDALRHFDAALRLDPGQSVALTGRARTLAALGRTTEALTAYRTALARRHGPEDALELGEYYESMGMERQAQAQYEVLRARVREGVAGGVDEELLIGRFEADHGDPQEAVSRLRAEWERQPGIEVADALGWALHRTGEDEEALRYASVATDRTKGGGVRSALYSFHRGMIERDLELSASARRDLREALVTNPYFSPLRVPVAQEALRELGEPPDEPVPE
ncbi:tetratricopeptide repeat protein [Streptomyces sp. NPDC006739]|uniref:tetratricopeptide repeat protein n=1 Tax=Streptomyces sp. NPDC006739 TaxID=3364763 RepID=UPI00369D9681